MFVRPIPCLIALMIFIVSQSTVSWAAPAIRISGFGTLGYAVTDNSESEYFIGRGVDGANDSGTFKLDSRLGIQFDTDFSPYFSGTIQALSRQNEDGEFTPEIEWAYLKGQVTDSVAIRVGRIGAPFFMVSDYREVGYANTTLRPPENTYYQVPLRNFNGADINGLVEVGQTLVSGQAFIGQNEKNFPNNTKINLKDTIGANVAFERGVAKLRLTHVSSRSALNNSDFNSIRMGLAAAAQLIPELSALAESFDGQAKQSTFTGMGLELDMDPWFVATEYTQRRIKKSVVPSFNAWYLTAGIRWKNFTPYMTLSQMKHVSKTEVILPPVPQLDPLRAPLNLVFSVGDQTTVAAGMRWDVFESAALKLQFEKTSRDSIGANFIEYDFAQSEISEDVNLLSVAMDFTF